MGGSTFVHRPMLLPFFQKKCCLGPQNNSGSLGPEKLLKIVNCATIKETKNMKETMMGVQVDLAGGHQSPPGSILILGRHYARREIT